MNQAKRVFTIEFKQECVNLVLNQGYSSMQAANAMGVGKSTMQHWVSQYRKELTGITPQSSAITPEQQHIQALEAEIRRLKRDNDLLKKASAFFATEMQNSNNR